MPPVDLAGNPCCGEDFMAGTICSLPPNHAGPHGTICQECGEDWYDAPCACADTCPLCGVRLRYDDECDVCDAFQCHECDPPSWVTAAEGGGHQHRTFQPVTQEELAETYRSLGVEPPTH